MRDSEPGEADLQQLGDDDEISLEPLFRILWSYRQVIVAATGVAVVLFVLFAAHAFLTRSGRHASLEFRVLFAGADRGEYPNGLPFAGSEITSTPVLSEVFSVNELAPYFNYETFRNAILIVQTPTLGLDWLIDEYNERLAGQMSPAARAVYEEEFAERRELLDQPLYTLDFVQPSGVEDLPDVLLQKVLHDILDNWARYAADSKHVFEYQVDVPGPNLLRTELVAGDNGVIRLDTLRGRSNRILRSLDELAVLPGATLVRIGEDDISLSDIRIQLEDLLRSSLRPLLVQLLSQSSTADRQAVASYIEAGLYQSRLDHTAAVADAAVLERSFQTYTSLQRYFNAPLTEPAAEFLNRVLSFAAATEAIDLPYRQGAIDRIVAAGREGVRLEKEVADYEEMAAWIRGERSTAAGVDGIDSSAAAIEQMEAVVAQSLQQANAIYTEISTRNLNPSTTLYSITSPFSVRTERGGFARALLTYGLLLTILMVTLVPAACVLHHWARRLARQSSVERARRRSAASPSQDPEVARPDGT